VFDFAVLSGPQTAIRALQEVLGVTPDGVIGPRTIAAAVKADGRAVSNGLVKWRAMMLARICRRDPSQLVFLAGWLKRTLDFMR
jgi:lysozyme family protein